jgi:hypothetical protein
MLALSPTSIPYSFPTMQMPTDAWHFESKRPLYPTLESTFYTSARIVPKSAAMEAVSATPEPRSSAPASSIFDVQSPFEQQQ